MITIKPVHYYLNGRQIKEEDTIRVNPQVKDEIDGKGQVIINPQLINWKEIDTKPAFYILAFSNDKFYAGSSKNVLNRITQHYKSFAKADINDWHKEIGEIIRRRAQANSKPFKYNFACVVRIFIQYTSSIDVAKQLEKTWLNKVYMNNKQDKYYNTIYFKTQKENLTKSNFEQEAKLTFNKPKFKAVNFLASEKDFSATKLTAAETEVIKLIDEKLSKLSKVGNIHIKFPDKEELVFKSTVPQDQLRRMLFQLMRPNNSTFTNKELKRKKDEHGGAFTLSELWVCIDGDTTYEKQEKEKHLVKEFLSTIPSCGGAYILGFPNGKKFIGSTKNLQSRIGEHLNSLLFKKNSSAKWHQLCKNEHGGKLSFNDICVQYWQTNDKKEKEKELLEENRSGGTIFY